MDGGYLLGVAGRLALCFTGVNQHPWPQVAWLVRFTCESSHLACKGLATYAAGRLGYPAGMENEDSWEGTPSGRCAGTTFPLQELRIVRVLGYRLRHSQGEAAYEGHLHRRMVERPPVQGLPAALRPGRAE